MQSLGIATDLRRHCRKPGSWNQIVLELPIYVNSLHGLWVSWVSISCSWESQLCHSMILADGCSEHGGWGKRKGGSLFPREAASMERGCKAVGAAGRQWHLLGDRTVEHERAGKWDFISSVVLRCEYPFFEFPTPRYLYPWGHFYSISMFIPKDPANTLAESLVGVSVWGWEQHWGWEVERGTSSGPIFDLQSWRVLRLCYLGQNIWHKINRAWRRLQMGKQFLDPHEPSPRGSRRSDEAMLQKVRVPSHRDPCWPFRWNYPCDETDEYIVTRIQHWNVIGISEAHRLTCFRSDFVHPVHVQTIKNQLHALPPSLTPPPPTRVSIIKPVTVPSERMVIRLRAGNEFPSKGNGNISESLFLREGRSWSIHHLSGGAGLGSWLFAEAIAYLYGSQWQLQ